jgi:hypothetical protein
MAADIVPGSGTGLTREEMKAVCPPSLRVESMNKYVLFGGTEGDLCLWHLTPSEARTLAAAPSVRCGGS